VEIPPSVGAEIDLVVESPESVLVVTRVGSLGAVLQFDVPSGSVTLLAGGFPVPREPNIAVGQGGRVFVTGSAGILEIDRVTGAVSVFAAAPVSYLGLDAEPGGASLLTVQPADVFPLGYQNEFVRIDLASGSATPLGEFIDPTVTYLELAANGDRFLFERTGPIDGAILRWSRSVDGESVEIASLRFTNANQMATEARLRLQLTLPFGITADVLDLGAAGGFYVPANFDRQLGPVTMFTLQPGQPRGAFQWRCALEDAGTGALLAEDVAPFLFE
jgi:hypothetical protein